MKTWLKKLLTDLETLPFEQEEAREAIINATQKVLENDNLLAKAEAYYNTLFGGEDIGRAMVDWEDKEADAILGGSMIFTVVYFARACYLMQSGAYLYDGKSVDFYHAVMRHLGVNIHRWDSFGFQNAQRYWAYGYIQPTFFELGRLAYEITKFSYAFRVYQDPETGKTYAFADADRHYDVNGLPDNDGEFVTTFAEENGKVTGYIFDSLGRLDFEKKCFTDLVPAIQKGDPVLSVHMPGSVKLDENEITKSLVGAKAFFEKYFPELQFVAFVSSTWLLDTGLRRFLREDANIVKLQNRFAITIAAQNGFSLFDNIFKTKTYCPLEELVPTNRFQQEVLDMVKAGGHIYTGQGYIMKEQIL